MTNNPSMKPAKKRYYGQTQIYAETEISIRQNSIDAMYEAPVKIEL